MFFLKKEKENHTLVLIILLLAKNLAIGGVRAMVMGTRMGNKALLQRKASATAPPVDAASSAVRFRFFSSMTTMDWFVFSITDPSEEEEVV